MNINRNNGDILNDAAYAQGTMDNNVRLAEVQNMFAHEVAILHEKMEEAYPANSAVHNALVGSAKELFTFEMDSLKKQIEKAGLDAVNTGILGIDEAQLMFRNEMGTLRKHIKDVGETAAKTNAANLTSFSKQMDKDVKDLKKQLASSITSQNELRGEFKPFTKALSHAEEAHAALHCQVTALHLTLVDSRADLIKKLETLSTDVADDLDGITKKYRLMQGAVNSIQRVADANNLTLTIINDAIDTKFAKLFPERKRWFPTLRKLFRLKK